MKKFILFIISILFILTSCQSPSQEIPIESEQWTKEEVFHRAQLSAFYPLESDNLSITLFTKGEQTEAVYYEEQSSKKRVIVRSYLDSTRENMEERMVLTEKYYTYENYEANEKMTLPVEEMKNSALRLPTPRHLGYFYLESLHAEDFEWRGEDPIAGRPAYRLHRKDKTKTLQKIWIDVETHIPVRVIYDEGDGEIVDAYYVRTLAPSL